MNYFAFPNIITLIIILYISGLAYLSNRKSKTNILFCLFGISLSGWLFSYAGMYLSHTKETALIWARFGFSFIVFIPILAYHFIITLLRKNQKKIMGLLYLSIIPSLCLGWTDFVYKNIGNYFWGYYPIAGPLYIIFLLSFILLFSMGLVFLYKGIDQAKQDNKLLLSKQIQYVFFAFLFSSIGLVDYIIKYGLEIYPFGYIGALFAICLIALAIIRYRLMDIKLVIANTTIFLFVYFFVLGIPLWLGFKYHIWQHSTWIALLLATAGPFIYLYIKHKAEAHLLQEERKVQELLLKASYGMNKLHNLGDLFDLIEDSLVTILGVSKVSIKISRDCPYFFKTPLVYEEIKMLAQASDEQDDESAQIKNFMKEMNASVLVPMIINDTLLGFIALGERSNKEIYSQDLLNALTVLGNQAALAIENCHYLEAETKRMQEEGLRDRMESLDHMASSMAHEIDNPMHGVRTSLGFIQDFILTDPRANLPEPLDTDMKDAITRIENCAERVSSMIKAILDYSRMGSGKLMPTSVNEAVKGFKELISPQMKKESVDFQVEETQDLPLVLGDKIQIEEILMNFARNALHAVKLEEHKKIHLKIFQKDEDTIRIECADNGYGVKPEILKDIFLSSMTTKGSSEGTGLGLYRVRKIVNLFKGQVWAESQGEGTGATFIAELPVLSGKFEELLKSNMK